LALGPPIFLVSGEQGFSRGLSCRVLVLKTHIHLVKVYLYRENFTKPLVRMERRVKQKRVMKKGKELMTHHALSEVERK
jgi:hypothetical protein